MLNKLFKFAGILVLVGLILGVVGVIALGKDKITDLFYDMSDDSEYVQETYDSVSEITNLDLQFVNRNVVIQRAEVTTIQVTYYQSEKDHIEFSEVEGTLEVTNTVRWQFFTFFNYVSNEKRMVNVVVPNIVEYDIKIVTTNGNIVLEDMATLHSLDIDTTNGTIKFLNSDVNGDVKLRASNGNIQVGKVYSLKLLVDTMNGEVALSEVESLDIDVQSTNGTIDLTKITCDDVHANATNGTINVQVIGNFEDYKITLRTVNGKIKYDDLTLSSGTIHPSATKILVATTVNGGVNISFIE